MALHIRFLPINWKRCLGSGRYTNPAPGYKGNTANEEETDNKIHRWNTQGKHTTAYTKRIHVKRREGGCQTVSYTERSTQGKYTTANMKRVHRGSTLYISVYTKDSTKTIYMKGQHNKLQNSDCRLLEVSDCRSQVTVAL